MNLNLLSALGHRSKLKLLKTLRLIKDALQKESVETTIMLKTYADFTQGKVGAHEMKLANQQFRNFLKTVGLGALAVLPFSPLTIPLIVKLGERMGIDVLPPSFRDTDDSESASKL